MTSYSHIVPDGTVYNFTARNGGCRDTWGIVIDEDGKVSIDCRTTYGSNPGTPASLWDKRTLRFPIGFDNSVVSTDDLRDGLDDDGVLSALIDRVKAGHSVEWSNSKGRYIGHLSDDAEDASFELQTALEGELYVEEQMSVWYANDYLSGSGRYSDREILDDLNLNPLDEIDGDRFNRAVLKIEEDALSDNVIVIDADEALQDCLRNERKRLWEETTEGLGEEHA